MQKIKSAQHHWWPRCVSCHWADEEGKTGRIESNGSVKRLPPDKLGMIGNGHHIKFGNKLGEQTELDTSFENEFDKADNHFPTVIKWLKQFEQNLIKAPTVCNGFTPQTASDNEIRMLTECVVSLAVRSPMNRQASVALADKLRGPIANPERDSLIGLNMIRSQRLIADSIGVNAKFAVLFSKDREFIFGDGFFHNVTCQINRPINPKILVPITPTISVIVAKPMQYGDQPRLSTIILNDKEVEQCNHAVMIYSRNELFFRSETPLLDEVFTCGKHKQYSDCDNPIDNLIRRIPGIPPRDRSLDFLLSKFC